MKNINNSFFGLFFIWSILLPGSVKAQVKYDKKVPQLEFAAQEIETALKEKGRNDLKVTLVIKADEESPHLKDWSFLAILKARKQR